MLRRVPPDEACGGAMGFSPWGSTYPVSIKRHILFRDKRTGKEKVLKLR
jgi:hypothetical protein